MLDLYTERQHRTSGDGLAQRVPNGMAVVVGPTAAALSSLRLLESQPRRRGSLQGGLLVVDAVGDGVAGLEEDGDEHVVSAEGEVVAFHRVDARAGE